MKITNKNIGYWIFGLAHIIPIILYQFWNGEHPSVIFMAFAVITILLSVVWILGTLVFISECHFGNIKFEIKIPIPFQRKYQNYIKKQKAASEIKKEIQKLKIDAKDNIDDEVKFEQIVKQIVSLENLLK